MYLLKAEILPEVYWNGLIKLVLKYFMALCIHIIFISIEGFGVDQRHSENHCDLVFSFTLI